MANYSYTDPADIVDGAVIDGGNFSQLLPNTEIMVGKVLTINGGNFTNVKQQPEWTVNGGNWVKVEYCSNASPDMITVGLAVCAENCNHVTSIDEIELDGVIVSTIYHYSDGVS